MLLNIIVRFLFIYTSYFLISCLPRILRYYQRRRVRCINAFCVQNFLSVTAQEAWMYLSLDTKSWVSKGSLKELFDIFIHPWVTLDGNRKRTGWHIHGDLSLMCFIFKRYCIQASNPSFDPIQPTVLYRFPAETCDNCQVNI